MHSFLCFNFLNHTAAVGLHISTNSKCWRLTRMHLLEAGYIGWNKRSSSYPLFKYYDILTNRHKVTICRWITKITPLCITQTRPIRLSPPRRISWVSPFNITGKRLYCFSTSVKKILSPSSSQCNSNSLPFLCREFGCSLTEKVWWAFWAMSWKRLLFFQSLETQSSLTCRVYLSNSTVLCTTF